MGKIVAVGGKGGVGKTFVSAILTKILRHRVRLLSIDADPSLGLTHAFTLSSDDIRTIWDIREELKEGPKRKKLLKDKDIPLKDVIKEQAVIKKDGFDFLVMGRSEGPGCFCSLNELLRYAIESLAKGYELVIVDCEAGLEQVKRRVLRKIDIFFIISDPTVRGIYTAKYLIKIAKELSEEKAPNVQLLLNMVNDIDKAKSLIKDLDVPIAGFIPNDSTVKEFDFEGRSLLEFPESSPSYQALLKCAKLTLNDLNT